jgi:hypothetical protein
VTFGVVDVGPLLEVQPAVTKSINTTALGNINLKPDNIFPIVSGLLLLLRSTANMTKRLSFVLNYQGFGPPTPSVSLRIYRQISPYICLRACARAIKGRRLCPTSSDTLTYRLCWVIHCLVFRSWLHLRYRVGIGKASSSRCLH